MLGTCVISLVVASAAFSPAQDLGAKVTFSSHAASARDIMKALSEQSGIVLETAPTTAGDILQIHVKDVPLSDLMKKIAEVASAEWKQEGTLYRLVRPAALTQAQQREEAAARGADYAKALQRFGSTASKPFDRAEAERVAKEPEARPTGRIAVNTAFPARQDPAGRLLARFVQAMRPEDFVAIAPSARIVFSTNPTRMQRNLPGAARNALNAFPAEHNTWASVTSSVPRETEGPWMLGPDLNAQPLQRPIGKALLIVQRFGADENLSLNVKVYDVDGKLVAQSSGFLQAGNSMGAAPAAPNAAPGTPLQYPQETVELAKLLSPGGGGGAGGARFMVAMADDRGGEPLMLGPAESARAPVSTSARALLSQPERFDPIGLLVGPALEEYAKGKNTPLVALLPDGVVTLAAPRVASSTMSSAWLIGRLQDALSCQVATKDGWTTIRPLRPHQTRESRIDRIALGRAMKAVFGQGYAKLDDLAAYAFSVQPGVPGNAFDVSYLRAASADAAAMLGGPIEDRRALLKFYATLGAAQRQNLRAGRPIRLGTLAPNQLGLLGSLVFNSLAGPQIQLPPRDGADVREERRMVMSGPGGAMLFSGGDSSLIQERTEALAAGLPNDGFLSVNFSEREAVLASPSNGATPKFFTASEYATYMATKDRPGFSPSDGAPADFKKFRQAVVVDMAFRFALTPQASMTGSLRDYTANLAGADVAYNQLPASFKNAVDASMERVARVLENTRIEPGRISVGGGRGDRPPQP